MYDMDNSNKISIFMLHEALAASGYNLRDKILDTLVHRYGDQDGNVCFDDFLMCAIKVKTMMGMFKQKDTNDVATLLLEEWILKNI